MAERADGRVVRVPTFVNEFWTSRQRAAHSLHEISYRACFKPQLPRFFIERLTEPGEVVYDPFMGRGTTPLEAALLGRVPFGCDINPLSAILLAPRLRPPTAGRRRANGSARLTSRRPASSPTTCWCSITPTRSREICALRDTCSTGARAAPRRRGRLDPHGRRQPADGALARVLLGLHAAAQPGGLGRVAAQDQRGARARCRRGADVPAIILKKTRPLLRDCDRRRPRGAWRARSRRGARLLTGTGAARTPRIPAGSVDLVVTSPPFLDVVHYAADNWLRCWFCGIDPRACAGHDLAPTSTTGRPR